MLQQSDTQISMRNQNYVTLLEALARYSPVIAQLRANNAFQTLIGHKASFLDIGFCLPAQDNLQAVSNWTRSIHCN